MVESSKILTVSYGTFSCTLEGFDDSFSTMKAIAEYFRDLAAGDRYFGAEPPTPDAEMLTKIAEREIARRVEAHSDESGITLRAGEALATAAPAAAVAIQNNGADDAATVDAADDAATVDAADDAAMPPVAKRPDDAPNMEITQANAAATADVAGDVAGSEAEDEASSTLVVSDHAMQATYIADVDATDEMDVDGDSGLTFAEMAQPIDAAPTADADSVAAKLQRIRAVVGVDAEDDDGYIEDLSSNASIDDAFEDDDTNDAPTDAELEADVAQAEAEEDAAEQAEAEAAAQAEAEAAAQAEAEAAAQAEAEAAAQAEAEAAAQAEAEAAAQAEADAAAQAEADAAAQAEAEAAAQAEADAAAQAEADAAAQAEADAAAQAEADAAAQAEEVAASEEDEESQTPDQTSDAQSEPAAAKPTIRARILRLARPSFTAGSEPENAVNGTATPNVSDDSSDMIANIAAKAAMSQKDASAEEEVPEEPTDASDAHSDIAQTGNAVSDLVEDDASAEDGSVADRIAAMNLAAEDQDDDDAKDEGEAPVLTLTEGSLSDEDEAELMQELADVEREATESRAEGRQGRDILPENDDAELSRIMDQADEQLSEPEGSRRRNAIAQLKAAVAATEAARQLGDDRDEKSVQENAFREDFKDVVRPRPASALPRTEVRRERPRPAPLKLVASQRVDESEAAAEAVEEPEKPVAPRRVAIKAAPLSSDADNFAEFAEEMGATELPDMLEAAAAYIAFVEGSEDFSRPQIIKKVQANSEQTFTREEGLRSFGTLLRQGRINKSRNGRFQVSDQTRFKPTKQAG